MIVASCLVCYMVGKNYIVLKYIQRHSWFFLDIFDTLATNILEMFGVDFIYDNVVI